MTSPTPAAALSRSTREALASTRDALALAAAAAGLLTGVLAAISARSDGLGATPGIDAPLAATSRLARAEQLLAEADDRRRLEARRAAR